MSTPTFHDEGVCEGCNAPDETVAMLAGRQFCAVCSPGSELIVRWEAMRAVRRRVTELERRAPMDDEVILHLLTIATDEQLTEAFRLAGEDLGAAAERTRKVLEDALHTYKARHGK